MARGADRDSHGTDAEHAHTVLVAGTASHVGKSTVAAGLCRRLADRGVSVAPFKAQNMSNNARAVPRATVSAVTDSDAVARASSDDASTDGDAFGEIGVSQYVQARAARVRPTTDHNPVLLKPTGDGESQLVLDGRAVDDVAAGAYYDDHWERALTVARDAHARLAAAHDVVVAEGAGSIAEINLHHRDLSNVETARFADASILLVVDIERGGAFAHVVGTLELLPNDLRERVVGVVITKFRGDASLLDPGIEELEARTGVPVLAVLPYDDPGLPEEDSVSLPAVGDRRVIGDDDGVAADSTVTIAVPRLPHASNVTDVEPLARVPGVRVAFVPLSAPLDADAVVLSGTKNTVDDLLACRDAGLLDRLPAFDGPVVGLCGGYQLLGESITHASLEGTDAAASALGEDDAVAGAGLLPVTTRFSPGKRVAPVRWHLTGNGPLTGVDATVEGYEIHAGRTAVTGEATPLFPAEDRAAGVVVGDVVGTYLHGLFDDERVREAFVDGVYDRAGQSRPTQDHAGRSRPTLDHGAETDPYDRAASLVSSVSLDALGLTVPEER